MFFHKFELYTTIHNMYNTLAKFGGNLPSRLISILKLPWSETPVKMSSHSDDQKKSRPTRLHFPVGRPRTIRPPSLLGKCDLSICKGVRSVIGAVFLFYVLRLQNSLREARYCAKRSAGGASEAIRLRVISPGGKFF